MSTSKSSDNGDTLCCVCLDSLDKTGLGMDGARRDWTGPVWIGADCIGRNAFNYNRNLIWNFNVDSKRGTKQWHNRLAGMRKALLEMPWKAGERRGEMPEDYKEEALIERRRLQLACKELLPKGDK